MTDDATIGAYNRVYEAAWATGPDKYHDYTAAERQALIAALDVHDVREVLGLASLALRVSEEIDLLREEVDRKIAKVARIATRGPTRYR